MNQERKPMEPEEIEVIIDKMQRRGKYSSEIIQLIQSDLEHGLTKTETEQYTGRKYDIRQMRVYSNCLRKDCTDQEIAVICKEGLSNSQMEVLYEFYEKGVPLETIRSIMEEADAVPQRMKKVYEKYQEEISKSKSALEEAKKGADVAEVDSDYLKELVAVLNGLSKKISFQESRYDELNKKLKLFETNKDDEAVRKKLIEELDEKDDMLEKQQEELNQATGAIARLRKEKENYEEEIRKMQNQKDELQKKIKLKEPVLQEESKSTQPVAFGIPVCYQIPVVDGNGQFIQKVSMESMEKKSKGVGSLFAKLCLKKKSRADIVKLVASGDLAPAQLVQIKSGIEKGLTESQLLELIHNNLAAEKMKEIIEIAVLENSME